MATISVYLQSAIEAADHVLYGVVNGIAGSTGAQTVTVSTSGGSGQNDPFEGAAGKTVRRYTGAQWNANSRITPAEVAAEDTGVIDTVTNTNKSFNTASSGSGQITNAWVVNDIWAIDFHSNSGGFHKWTESDKISRDNTADEENPADTPGTTTTRLPRFTTTKTPTPFSKNGDQDVDPLTTKWELKCDQISRNYTNSAIPLPLPAIGMGDQYYNMILDIGMRQETINLQGTLVDRGVPTASNPRLQTLFDLARTQHVVLLDTTDSSQGGEGSVPNNPRAYMRLTIGSGYEPSDYTESVGSDLNDPVYDLNTNIIVRDRNYTPGSSTLGAQRTEKAFRGMVTSFNATLMGGQPDIWRWQMTFSVVKNEHDWTFKAD